MFIIVLLCVIIGEGRILLWLEAAPRHDSKLRKKTTLQGKYFENLMSKSDEWLVIIMFFNQSQNK